MRDKLTPMGLLQIELNERLNHRQRSLDIICERERASAQMREEIALVDAEIDGLKNALATLAGPQPLSP